MKNLPHFFQELPQESDPKWIEYFTGDRADIAILHERVTVQGITLAERSRS